MADNGLPGIYPDVVRLRLAGCTTREMAAQLNVSRQTVSRARALLPDRLWESAAAAATELVLESTAECDETSRDRNIAY